MTPQNFSQSPQGRKVKIHLEQTYKMLVKYY